MKASSMSVPEAQWAAQRCSRLSSMPRTFAPVASFTTLARRRCQTAELGMAEAVGAGGLGLGDEAAVGIVDALGDGDDAVAVFLVAGG